MHSKISVASLVMLAGAVVTLLFSFFGFYKGGDESFSAWDTDVFAFVTAVPAILALAMIVWVGCELAGVNLPQDVLTFNPSQLKATWGIAAAGLMLAFVATAPTGSEKSAFFWLQVLGALAMAAGSVMALLGMGSETVNLPSTSSSSQPAQPQQPGQAPPPPPQAQPPHGQQPPPPAPGSNPPPPPPPAP